jgi:lysophospholipid acyltransferase (LPLAT)-like uncharacterized protein
LEFTLRERLVAGSIGAVFGLSFNQTLRHCRHHCKWHFRGPLDEALRSGQQLIVAAWHQDVLPFFLYLINYTSIEQRQNFVMLVSRSFDGEVTKRILGNWRFEFVRGSAGKAGGRASLLGLTRALRRGKSVVMIADGPRPPANQMRPGPVFLARSTGVPLYVARAWCRPQILIPRVWFRLVVPLPFANYALFSEGPLDVSGDFEEARERAESTQNDLCVEADAHLYLRREVKGGVSFVRRPGETYNRVPAWTQLSSIAPRADV